MRKLSLDDIGVLAILVGLGSVLVATVGGLHAAHAPWEVYAILGGLVATIIGCILAS